MVLLIRTSVRFMKYGLFKSGSTKDRIHFPATVTDVSCPSLAGEVSLRNRIDCIEELTHVRCNEDPLREFICFQISFEHSEILILGKAVRVRGDRVIAHQWAIRG